MRKLKNELEKKKMTRSQRLSEEGYKLAVVTVVTTAVIPATIPSPTS